MRRNLPALFKGRHFEPEIILLCVRWYLRFGLSFRNLEELMMERNLTVDHVSNSALGAEIRSGVTPALPPGTAHDEPLLASG